MLKIERLVFLWLKVWDSNAFPLSEQLEEHSLLKPALSVVVHWLARMACVCSAARQVLTIGSAGNAALIMGALEKGVLTTFVLEFTLAGSANESDL